MEITFLNVGHGDSIGLKWNDSGTEKIGIVDCKKNNNSVPTIEYLKSKENLQFIDFIVLTHPHIDHYSGFPELLSYIKNSNIKIKNFGKHYII